MPISGLDLLEKNAPNSNLPPFDMKVPEGTTAESLAEKVTKIGQAKSGLELLETETPKAVEKTVIPPQEKVVNPESYNVESLMSKLVPKALPDVAEDEKKKESYGAALALNRLWSLAKGPYDVVKGSAEFVSSLPGFALGVGGAAWNLSKALGGGANLEQAYEAAAKGMEENAGRWQQSMVEPLGRLLDMPKTLGTKAAELVTGKELPQPKSDSAFVGELAMAPLTAVTATAHKIADSSWLDSYPNVRGAIRFGGDVLGLLTIGRIYKGGSSEYAKDVEPIINKAGEIDKRQKIVDEIPNEAIKAAQQKVLEVEKVQLELEAKRLQEKLDHEKIAAEDLKAKGEEVKELKRVDIQDLIKEGKVTVVQEGIKKKGKSVKSINELEQPTAKSGLDVLEPKELTSEQWQAEAAKVEGIKFNGMQDNVKGKPPFPLFTLDRKDIEPTTFAVKPGETLQQAIDRKYVQMKKAKAEPITEVDLQTGTPLPKSLSPAEHPFRDKDVAQTNTMSKMFIEKIKNKEIDPEVFTRYLINEVNRHLNGEEPATPIEKVISGLRNAATNAENARLKFDTRKDFEAWRDTVQEASRWAGEAVGIKGKEGSGTILTMGIDPTQIPEATRKIIEGAKALVRYTADARGMKAFKPGTAADKLKEEFTRSFVDRSGNIRRDLLNELGNDGYEIVQKMYLSKGASSLAAQQLKQMRKEVYDGLTKDDKRILDNLILADRMIDIGKYKTKAQFKFPEGLNPEQAAAYNELFQYIEKVPAEKAELLLQRAKAYFDWMKKPLQDMLDAELISKEEFDALSSHNYRRLKLVDVFDKRYQTKIGKKMRTVYDSGVEVLSHGRDTDVFEPSSEVMALEVFNRAYGRILNNAANRTLLDLARTQKDNPFVAVKESASDHILSGWDRVFVYEKGERKVVYLSPEMSKEWITNNPEMSYKLSQFIRYASGSPVLRTFATGIDWGFALANLPRDIMHIWYASRVFENGEWKPLYNSTLPVYGGQMAGDIGGVFNDAILRKGKYQDYIKEGGGMEFLVHQGRLLQRGRHLEGPLDKVQDFLGYLGETSEIVTRLAIRDRVIKRRAAEQGISYEEAAKDKKITTEATFAARDYMDFGQGGGISKALDNGLPYLNASIQGTRGMFRAFKDNPAQSTYKLAQFAALVTGLYIANQSINPGTMKDLKGDINMQGNLVIPLGDGFGFLDEKGQKRYPFIKVPLDPGQKFFKMFFEAAYDKHTGQTVDVDGLTNSFSQISPVGISSLPPTVSGTLGYIMNKDFWLNEEIWKKTDKPLGWPSSKEEFIPGKTPEAMIDIGSVTGLSPERLKYALSELVTSGSPWSWLVGQGYDAAFKTLPAEKKEQHLAEVLSKAPIAKRFIGITNPYSKFATPVEEAREEGMLKRWVENRGLDQRVDAFLFEGGKRSDVIEYINHTSKDAATHDRLKDRFIFSEKIKDLPNRSFWLAVKGTPDTEARAKLFVQRFDTADPKEKEQLNKEIGIVQSAGGIISDEFKQAVMKIRDQKAKGTVR